MNNKEKHMSTRVKEAEERKKSAFAVSVSQKQ